VFFWKTAAEKSCRIIACTKYGLPLTSPLLVFGAYLFDAFRWGGEGVVDSVF